MPFIEIDGKKVEAEPGSMIIEVADSICVQIPRFCYHKKLSVAANCRMCLVEVERAPKPLPACATPVTEGMKVWTRSPVALLAQKSVMEFLLINHPLDCPICDQGGECELQDLSIGYGNDTSRYTEGKRVVVDKNLGPLISTDMTRCIQCTRCVRFGSEVAGVRELGATGKGELMEIGTFIEHSVDSEVSGNIIDLCPVGALTSKPYRFTARGWELKQSASISPHDCMGSNIYIHTRSNHVMRVVPKENELINEVWISDRDRYSYEGLYHSDRLEQPKIKQNGQWQVVSWEEALSYSVNAFLKIRKNNSASNIGALVSPNATLEEGYLLQKLLRGLGSNNIDHRLRQSDFRIEASAPLFPNLGVAISEIEEQSVVLLLGSALRQEQPLFALKLRKLTLLGGKVLVINPIDFSFNFEITEKSIVPGGDLVLGVARILKAVFIETQKNIPDNLKSIERLELLPADINIAKLLLSNNNPNQNKKLIILGALAISHPDYSSLISLANLIAESTNAKVGYLTEGANTAGAWLAGCVPHRLPGGIRLNDKSGLNASEMLDSDLKGYLLFNLEPDLDSLNGQKTINHLSRADCVVAITPYESQSLLEVADVLLPMTPFTETSGTFVNIEGKWQSFKAAAVPLGNSRPGWKICRVLGNLCDLESFDFESSEDVLAELKSSINFDQPESEQKIANFSVLEFQEANRNIVRIAPVGLYSTDGLVRRAKSLQETVHAKIPSVVLNKNLVQNLSLKNNQVKVISNGVQVVLPYIIDEAVPDNSVWIASGFKETMALGEPYALVQLESV